VEAPAGGGSDDLSALRAYRSSELRFSYPQFIYTLILTLRNYQLLHCPALWAGTLEG